MTWCELSAKHCSAIWRHQAEEADSFACKVKSHCAAVCAAVRGLHSAMVLSAAFEEGKAKFEANGTKPSLKEVGSGV